MKRLALILLLAGAACGRPETSSVDAQSDRAVLEAAVADCDAGMVRPDCAMARKRLSEIRREARLAVYRSKI